MDIINVTEKEDFKEIALLHCKDLPGGLLPLLGPEFLAELYHSIIKKYMGVCYAVKENNRIAGFVIGTLQAEEIFGSVIYSNLKLIYLLIKSIFLHPYVILKVIETILYSKKTESEEKIDSELLVIVVDSSSKRKGYGSKLVEKLEQYFKDNNMIKYKLTVKQRNNNANAFYVKKGFYLSLSFKLYGEFWNLYVKEI